MIQAKTTTLARGFRLEIVHPDTNQAEFIIVPSVGEGKRVVYFKNRQYMLGKITGWLKQRMYSPDSRKSAEAAKLLVLLGYYQNISFEALCRVIHKHRLVIDFIAPAPRSNAYKYYASRIAPLLNDAAEMEGAV